MPTKWPNEEWPFPDAGNTDIHWTAFVEPEMWGYIMCAQATFLEFARCADLERFRVVPTYDEIAIKAFFATADSPQQGEHIFLSNVTTDGQQITATLNATSKLTTNLIEGQQVTFPIGKLSDWFLVRNGNGIGGLTVPMTLAKLPPAERTLVVNQPPYAWFDYRKDLDPTDQLADLPMCTECGRRNIGDPDNRAKICGICRNGGRRCNCACGAPLIRFPGAPNSCHRCLTRVPA